MRREPERKIDGTSRRMRRTKDRSRIARWLTKIHNVVYRFVSLNGLYGKREANDPSSRLPSLGKWLVKLIRAKWSLNGVGIDWQGCAAGFCTTGTSRMFDHPEPYNYRVECGCVRPRLVGQKDEAARVDTRWRPPRVVANCHALLSFQNSSFEFSASNVRSSFSAT